MGCDIHAYVEIRRDGTWHHFDEKVFGHGGLTAEPFDWRDYGLFGFLADVRNYSRSPVIAEPRGIPDDVSPEVLGEYDEWGVDAHTPTWLTAAELLAYDYDAVFWDRRVTKNGNGAALAEEGEGEDRTLRDLLGTGYFGDLDQLAKLGMPDDVRVVFWFDN
jgi:hypothetical protein